jgi:hypothetical protein
MPKFFDLTCRRVFYPHFDANKSQHVKSSTLMVLVRGEFTSLFPLGRWFRADKHYCVGCGSGNTAYLLSCRLPLQQCASI